MKTLGQAILSVDIEAIQASLRDDPVNIRRLNRAMLMQAVGNPFNPDPDLPKLPRDQRLAVVRVLLQAGADVDSTDGGSHFSLLHVAALESDLPLIDLAIEFGSRMHLPSTPTMGQLHPLLCAIMHGASQETIEHLLDKGADIHAQDYNGDGVIAFAAARDKGNLVDMLLARGSDLNWQNRRGQVPLLSHFSSLSAHMAMHLMQSGADLRAPDEHGATASDYAARHACPAADAVRAYLQRQALSASVPDAPANPPRPRL